jgi:hypothetical protein
MSTCLCLCTSRVQHSYQWVIPSLYLGIVNASDNAVGAYISDPTSTIMPIDARCLKIRPFGMLRHTLEIINRLLEEHT